MRACLRLCAECTTYVCMLGAHAYRRDKRSNVSARVYSVSRMQRMNYTFLKLSHILIESVLSVCVRVRVCVCVITMHFIHYYGLHCRQRTRGFLTSTTPHTHTHHKTRACVMSSGAIATTVSASAWRDYDILCIYALLQYEHTHTHKNARSCMCGLHNCNASEPNRRNCETHAPP